MLAVLEATAPPQNRSSITPGTKAPFYSALTRHETCLLIALSPQRPKDVIRTIRKVGAIKIVAISAPATLGLRAPPRPLGSIQPSYWFNKIVIVAATGQHVGKIKTWAEASVIIVTRKAILPINTLSLASQKTSIGLDNLFVGDWYWYGSLKGESPRQGPLHLLPSLILQG